MPILETVNLFQTLNEREILKNINLTVDKGEVLAIIGPTGAGKTTLLRLLNTLELPSSGKIIIDGTDTSESAATEGSRTQAQSFELATRAPRSCEPQLRRRLRGAEPNLGR